MSASEKVLGGIVVCLFGVKDLRFALEEETFGSGGCEWQM
jgi:hypothetical protein